MKEYRRKHPIFSLCGLNCGLCPRYHTEGESRCPGCGGPNFHLKHPTCAVITCSLKHEAVEYCFQCRDYPCHRYREPSTQDSFISYRNVLRDLACARDGGLEAHLEEIDDKMRILEFLLRECNDGRRKAFYCTAVQLLSLEQLQEAIHTIQQDTTLQSMDLKHKTIAAATVLRDKAANAGIELALRRAAGQK